MPKTIKIVIHRDHGGFSVSKEVYEELGLKYDGYGFIENEDLGIESECSYDYRSDPKLIAAIKKVGSENLSIVEIPADVKWKIQEYDGAEWIAEEHRTW